LPVASKCGFDVFGTSEGLARGAVTNSPSHIKEYIEGTIERLGFTPDLYYLHRIDPSKYHTQNGSLFVRLSKTDTPLQESIPALAEIRQAGKTRYIGLSECSAATLRKANSSK
jgi:aryl-alcohol dehydrogenase-like predicted oxidoreductase